jgi:hypothetical protein
MAVLSVALRRISLVFASLICCFQPAAAIVGGAAQTAGSARYHVVLIEDADKHSCTGTVLGNELVLTAAHCVYAGRDFKILSVDSNHLSTPINVASIELHPQYGPQEILGSRATADLALLKLATPLSLVISAPSLGHRVEAGERYTIVGYGVAEYQNKKSFGTLRAAELVVTGHPGSRQIRLVDPATGGTRAGLGMCNGDAGAPAIQDIGGQLVGISVWSTGPGESEGCGGLSGLIPLAPHTDWIATTAQRLGSPIEIKMEVSPLPLMSAVDFLVDYRSLIGREVSVGPCKIGSADSSSVFCTVHNPAGNRVGTIILRSESMDRESLRRSLMDCAGFRPAKPCDASSVSGLVTESGGDPRLDRAVINWR